MKKLLFLVFITIALTLPKLYSITYVDGRMVTWIIRLSTNNFNSLSSIPISQAHSNDYVICKNSTNNHPAGIYQRVVSGFELKHELTSTNWIHTLQMGTFATNSIVLFRFTTMSNRITAVSQYLYSSTINQTNGMGSRFVSFSNRVTSVSQSLYSATINQTNGFGAKFISISNHFTSMSNDLYMSAFLMSEAVYNLLITFVTNKDHLTRTMVTNLVYQVSNSLYSTITNKDHLTRSMVTNLVEDSTNRLHEVILLQVTNFICLTNFSTNSYLLTNNPVVWHRMESSNAGSSELGATPVFLDDIQFEPAKFSNGVDFSKRGSVVFNQLTNITSSNFTLTFYARMKWDSTNYNPRVLADNYIPAPCAVINWNAVGNGYHTIWLNGVSVNAYYNFVTPTFESNDLIHFAMLFDSSAGIDQKIKVYENGVLDTFVNTIYDDSWSPTAWQFDFNNSTDYDLGLNAPLVFDNIKFYNRLLSYEEIISDKTNEYPTDSTNVAIVTNIVCGGGLVGRITEATNKLHEVLTNWALGKGYATTNQVIAATNGLNGKITLVSNTLYNTIISISNNLDSKIISVSNNLSSQILSISNNLDNKITSVSNNLDNKITSISNNLSSQIVSISNTLSSQIISISNDIINLLGTNQLHKYSGVVSMPTITGTTDGRLDIGSNGIFNLYSSVDFTGPLRRYSLSSLTNQQFISNTTYYVIVNNTTGTPVYEINTVYNVNGSDKILVARFFWEHGINNIDSFQIQSYAGYANGLPEKFHIKDRKIYGFQRESGLTLGYTTNRGVTVSSGIVWDGVISYSLDSIDTTLGDLIQEYYVTNGTWEAHIKSTFNNSNYIGLMGELETVADGAYVINWVYRLISDSTNNNRLYVFLDDKSNATLLQAQAAAIPNYIPFIVQDTMLLLGRIIVQKSSNVPTQVDSAFTKAFATSPVAPKHNDLSGLQGGAPNDYNHVTTSALNNLVNISNIFETRVNSSSKSNSLYQYINLNANANSNFTKLISLTLSNRLSAVSNLLQGQTNGYGQLFLSISNRISVVSNQLQGQTNGYGQRFISYSNRMTSISNAIDYTNGIGALIIASSNGATKAITNWSIWTVFGSSPYGRRYFYVATNGIDTNSGTFERPFLTLQRAVNRMSSGNNVTSATTIMMPGTYTQQVMIMSNKNSGIMSIVNFDATRVVLRGTGVGNGIKIQGTKNIIIKGLIITNYNYGICMVNVTNNKIMSNWILGNMSTGIHLSNFAYGCFVTGNQIIKNGGSGVATWMATAALYTKNIIDYNTMLSNGLIDSGTAGVRLGARAQSNIIKNNDIQFHLNGGAGIFLEVQNAASPGLYRNQILSNKINNSATYGLRFSGFSTKRTKVENVLAFNRIYRSGVGVTIDSSSNNLFYNNDVVSNLANGGAFDIDNNVDCKFINNIVLGNRSGPGFEGTTLTGSVFKYNSTFGNKVNYSNDAHPGSGCISNNPRIRSGGFNRSSPNFLRISSASPCIDAGTNIDYTFQGSKPDIGFAEYDYALPEFVTNYVRTFAMSNDRIFPTDIQRYGFLTQTNTAVGFTGGITVTLSNRYPGTTWYYYRNGRKWSQTSNRSVNLTGTTNGKWFISIDSTNGSLTATKTPWDYNSTSVFVASVFVSNVLSPKFLLADERHTCLIDRRMHLLHHTSIGTAIVSAGQVSGLLAASTVNSNKTFAISQTVIADEDLFHTLPANPDGNAVTNNYTLIYRKSASTWSWTNMVVPFYYSSADWRIRYDNSGTMTIIGNGNYVCYYIGACNVRGRVRFFIVPGRGSHSTLALAQAESFGSFDMTGFPLTEIIVMYKLIYHESGTASAANIGECEFDSIQSVSANLITSTVVPSTPHNSLSGLQGGTNSQYYHLPYVAYSNIVSGGDNSNYMKLQGMATTNYVNSVEPDFLCDWTPFSFDNAKSNSAGIVTTNLQNGNMEVAWFTNTNVGYSLAGQFQLPTDLDTSGNLTLSAYGFAQTILTNRYTRLRFSYSLASSNSFYDSSYGSVSSGDFFTGGSGKLIKINWSAPLSGTSMQPDQFVRMKLNRVPTTNTALSNLTMKWGLTHFRLKAKRK